MAKYNKKPTLIIAIIVGLLLIGIYFVINPESSLYAPKCIFKMTTGWDCPSCGSQRALHALLHGEISRAIKFNPFIFLVMPYLIALTYSTCSNSRLSQRLKSYTHHHNTVAIYWFLYFLWWIIRNTTLWQSCL